MDFAIEFKKTIFELVIGSWIVNIAHFMVSKGIKGFIIASFNIIEGIVLGFV